MSRTRAQALRAEFDEAFSRPPASAGEAREKLLGVRLGTEAYALKLKEITGLIGVRAITQVPSRLGSLLGLTGVRSDLVPVYSLAALLGYPRPSTPPRWMALVSFNGDTLGLGFEVFDGHFDEAASALFAADPRQTRHHVAQMARLGDGLRGVISVPSVISAVQQELNHG